MQDIMIISLREYSSPSSPSCHIITIRHCLQAFAFAENSPRPANAALSTCRPAGADAAPYMTGLGIVAMLSGACRLPGRAAGRRRSYYQYSASIACELLRFGVDSRSADTEWIISLPRRERP